MRIDNGTVRSMLPEEKPLFFRAINNERRSCIGHMRGDFGRSGQEFWSSWFFETKNLHTEQFRRDLDELVESLREGPLQSFSTVQQYCRDNPRSRMGDDCREFHALVAENEHYKYCILLNPVPSDYNFYIWCHDKRA